MSMLTRLQRLIFTTEGEVEFRSALFVPSTSSAGIAAEITTAMTKNIRCHVKRVFISDDFGGELFSRHLGFVKGVSDSNDLPLNVSREILQESRIVRIMKKRLVRKTFEMIKGIADSNSKEVWENFGKHMELGCLDDRENHKHIAPLLRFFASHSADYMISLDEYVANMKPAQKVIYL